MVGDDQDDDEVDCIALKVQNMERRGTVIIMVMLFFMLNARNFTREYTGTGTT
jgi:hypothetical protein